MASCYPMGQPPPIVSDPGGVLEIYVENISMIEMVDGNIKITLSATRDLGDGLIEEVAKVRLITSVRRVPTGIGQLLGFLRGRMFLSANKPDDIVPH